MNEEALVSRYGQDLVTRVKTLIHKAREHHVKIATAESLTAGSIAHLIYSLDSNHDVLSYARAVYNNNAKADMLGVSRDDLQKYEAVSEPVARQMAEGALTGSSAQIGVAVTGYSGPWGDETRSIDGGTVFIGASHQLPEGKRATHVEELHFDKARSLDIRKTVIAAVGALELALDAYINTSETLSATITGHMQSGIQHDPWLKAMYDTAQLGEPSDSLLIQEYGANVIKRIKALHVRAMAGNQKIAVAGDGMASEIAHMLTTLNGASKVVDRAYIVPDAEIRNQLFALDTIPVGEKAAAMARQALKASPATLAIGVYQLNHDQVAIAIATTEKTAPEPADIITLSEGKEPMTRQVAKHALAMFERVLQPQQQNPVSRFSL